MRPISADGDTWAKSMVKRVRLCEQTTGFVASALRVVTVTICNSLESFVAVLYCVASLYVGIAFPA